MLLCGACCPNRPPCRPVLGLEVAPDWKLPAASPWGWQGAGIDRLAPSDAEAAQIGDGDLLGVVQARIERRPVKAAVTEGFGEVKVANLRRGVLGAIILAGFKQQESSRGRSDNRAASVAPVDPAPDNNEVIIRHRSPRSCCPRKRRSHCSAYSDLSGAS